MALQIDELVKLQALDTSLGKLLRTRKALNSGEKQKADLDRKSQEAQRLDAELRRLQTDLTAAELELKTLEGKISAAEKKLYGGKVTVPRELQALEHEIEMFGRQRGRLDELILTRMDEIGTITPQVGAARAEETAARQTWEKTVAQYKTDLALVESEIGKLWPQRQQAAAAVQPTTLKRYEDIRARAQNVAVARLDGDRCGACGTSVAGVLVVQIKEAERYVYCESCSRFILPPT